MKPRRPRAEFAVPEWVEAQTKKFVFPDFDTLPIAAQPGGAGGAPTVVVAAADASDLSKSKADLVCTGTSDELIIQQAIELLPPPGVSPAFDGDRVLLTEGVFNVVTNIMDLSGRRATFQGLGAATRIRTTTATGCVLGAGDFSVIRDVYFQGSSTEAAIGGTSADIGIGTGGNGVLVDNCVFNGFDVDNYLSGNQWILRGCRIDGNDPIFVSGHGQTFQSIIVEHNVEVGDIVIASGDYWEIVANVLQGGVSCDSGAQHPSIVGNTILAASPTPGAQAMFELVASIGGEIAGNIMDANGWGGVFLDGADNVTVIGNTIRGPDTGIEVAGDENLIIANNVIPAGADLGINIASGNNNAVYANYLGDSSAYGTADFADAGTGTMTAPGANGQFVF